MFDDERQFTFRRINSPACPWVIIDNKTNQMVFADTFDDIGKQFQALVQHVLKKEQNGR